MTREASIESQIDQLQSQTRRLRRWVVAGFIVLVILAGWNLTLLRLNSIRGESLDKSQLFWMICHGSQRTVHERTAAFLDLVSAGNAEWRGARLDRLELKGVDLAGAALREADFESSNFSECNLSGADLHHSDLTLVDMRGAQLTNADLSGAVIVKANLSGVEAREATFAGANLQEAALNDASLLITDLSDAVLILADLRGANLTGANLTGALLEAANLRNAELLLANFANAKLADADLSGSNWWRARGLSTTQIAELIEKFPPAASADDSRKEDFKKWRDALAPQETSP